MIMLLILLLIATAKAGAGNGAVTTTNLLQPRTTSTRSQMESGVSQLFRIHAKHVKIAKDRPNVLTTAQPSGEIIDVLVFCLDLLFK